MATIRGKLVTRPGSEIFDEDAYLLLSGNKRVSNLIDFRNTDLLVQSEDNIFYIDSGAYQYLTGPTGNDALSNSDETNHTSSGYWKSHILLGGDGFSIPQKIYKDGSDNFQIRNAGLPDLATAPVVTVGAAGARDYFYTFIYSYQYMAQSFTFQDFGPRTIVELANSADPSINPNAISAIPVLANGSDNNWDTANIKVKIYRNTDGGSTQYFIGEVTNGTTVFTDNFSDASIQDNLVIYTDGGIKDNDPPPLCKYVHITNNIGWYAHTKDGSEILTFRVRQSVQNDFDSCPVEFFVDVEEEIIGISSFKEIPLVFGSLAVYRLDGIFNEDGSGGITQQKINDSVGCVSNNSIVKTIHGTFFAGTDGFYFTDGFNCTRISNDYNSTYQSFVKNAPEDIFGAYDFLNNRIYWSLKEDSGSDDNDKIYVLNLNFGVRPDSCFSTISGAAEFLPTALLFRRDGNLIRGDKQGYVFKHSDTIYTDPKVDILSTPDLWAKRTIIYNYISAGFKMGTTYMRKWATRIVVTADDVTKLALQCRSINDDGKRTADLAPLSFTSVVVWGDDDIIWGDPNIIWNFQGIIEVFRRFPGKSLRYTFKQIQFTNAYVEIASSDTNGQSTIDSTLKTAMLINAGVVWPQESIDYYISFSDDSFVKEYLITDRTDTVLTFEDIQNLCPVGNFEWKINGYPKGQVLNLLSYCINFTVVGKTQQHL